MSARFDRACGYASRLFITLGAIGLVLMTAIIGWQVFSRYVLHASPAWTEQGALCLMIWYISFATAAGVREGFHIRITILQTLCSPRVRRFIEHFCDVIVGLCGAAMCVWGAQLVHGTWAFIEPAIGIPRGMVYLGLPISGALIVIFSLERIAARVSNRSLEEDVEA